MPSDLDSRGEQELEVDPVFYLEVELMFADLSQHGGADRVGDHPDIGSAEFKGVSTQWYRLRGCHKGVHEFCPVVFDEFHERHLAADLGLALALDVQAQLRPDLRIVLMSATLDGERLAHFLDAPRLTAEGRAFPVTVKIGRASCRERV